jgi:hypothetical protein
MEGNLPTKIETPMGDKFALSLSPLDICLGYFAISCVETETEEDSLDQDSTEAVCFALTALLKDYESIYCYEFEQFYGILKVSVCVSLVSCTYVIPETNVLIVMNECRREWRRIVMKT